MAAFTTSISKGTYASLTSPGRNVYSTVTSHSSSGAKSTVKSGKSSHLLRLAAVGLGLLCAILLIATIALCVLHTRERGLEVLNDHNCTWRDYKGQLQRDYISLSNEKDQLQRDYTSLSNENDQLQRDYISLSNVKDQLLIDYKRVYNQRDQKQRDLDILSNEKAKLQEAYDRLSSERNQLQSNCHRPSRRHRPQGRRPQGRRPQGRRPQGRRPQGRRPQGRRPQKRQPQRHRRSQKGQCITCPEGWKQLSSKCYFFSTLRKSWEDSLQDCKLQGADLVIIRSQEEQEFINQHAKGGHHWIGLKDSANRTFEWVDGTLLQQAFWKAGSPDENRRAHCVLTGPGEELWVDTQCDFTWMWICETDASCV